MAIHVTPWAIAWLAQAAARSLGRGDEEHDAASCLAWDDVLAGGLDLQAIKYSPLAIKSDAPQHIIGAAYQHRAVWMLKNRKNYLDSNPFPAVTRPSQPFHNDLAGGFVNRTHGFLYFKPTKTAGTSLWRGWLEPTLCPAGAVLQEGAAAAARTKTKRYRNREGRASSIAVDPNCQAANSLQAETTEAEWQELWGSLLVFMTVRSPMERALSSYKYLVPRVKTALALLHAEPVSWEQFCDDPTVFARVCWSCQQANQVDACRCHVGALMSHVSPQTAGLAKPTPSAVDANGSTALNVDRLVRVERFEQDLEALCGELGARMSGGLKCRALHLQVSKPVDVSEPYGTAHAGCLAGVLRYYCWDFVNLRVTLELPGGAGRRVRVCPGLCRAIQAERRRR